MRLDMFSKRIYPLWASIDRVWREAWDKPDCPKELEIVHKIDRAIIASGEKIDRSSWSFSGEKKAIDKWL